MEQIKIPKTGKGDPDKFIGDVYVDMITGPDAVVTVGWVHFSPGSRNAGHTHATGQTLHCTAGYGLVVTDDEVIALRPVSPRGRLLVSATGTPPYRTNS